MTKSNMIMQEWWVPIIITKITIVTKMIIIVTKIIITLPGLGSETRAALFAEKTVAEQVRRPW